MAEEQADQPGKIETRLQVSAGGVAFRRGPAGLEVALVRVPPNSRWQLPKGLVDEEEAPEATAVREVQEEAGVETELLAAIETIEYWYIGHNRGRRVRFHKFVHFFLLAYRAGDVANHDHEVEEARWVEISQAIELLAFKSEKKVVEKAQDMIATLDQ
ncbi:MAG: NUDIX hydrolase [Chloroflexi bacterium]|nr:NUDIX hydrolase [Chloroflexota bacterium]MCI0576598.1 NUDIX hydrolase [Chloroflexota bacterium]MCI0647034.1 NUDIX hydrolase [Chloroflexota bacterium]MCI0730734.1 NUDIX hydrolase [Chloroflexota bacterium]